MERKSATSQARERILDTADRLFYCDGLRSVGIDRIIAEAGVAKMTLYTHFPSKDALILAVLKRHEVNFNASFIAAVNHYTTKLKDPVKALFAALKDWFNSPGFRGCAFINASVELADPRHAGSAFVRAHNERFSGFLLSLIEQTLGKAAAKHLPALFLIVNGAIITAAMQGTADAADVARDAALKLLREDKN